MKRMFLTLLGLLLLSGMLPAAGASAQNDSRCFPETGQCISGAIRSYWERNGGLPVFGYPTTALTVETIEGSWTGPVQWFERDRLEDHSAQGQGVLAGRLGAQRLEQLGRAWQPGQPVVGSDCRFFAETGHTTCGGFRTYWERNGGLARFGYPITEAAVEILEGRSYTVQYFERRRMEFHPENAAPFDILLGLLGNEVRAGGQAGGTCTVAVLQELQYNRQEFSNDIPVGCPLAGQDYSYTQAAAARFERGQMYWVQLRGGQSVIYVISYGQNNTLSYKLFQDNWREGDPVNTGLTPPAGRYEPQRGFGKIWRENQSVRDALGWALETERAETVSYQVFDRGALLLVQSEQVTWQFFGNTGARNARTRYY